MQLMQLLAMITMLIDHVGKVYFPDEIAWRIAGRLAFPIYAYYIVVGYRHTKSIAQYLKRLFILALISQVPYMLALSEFSINAVGSLFVCLLVLYCLDRNRLWLSVPLTIAAAATMELIPFDYSSYGLCLVLIYRYTRSHYVLFAHLFLTMIYLPLKNWDIQLFSIVATMAIIYGPTVYSSFEHRSVPRWLWRSFYPAHLFLIALIKVF